MPKNSDRAPRISPLVVALAAALVALVAFNAGCSSSGRPTASSVPSAVITTAPSRSATAVTTTPSPSPSVAGRLTGLPHGSKVAFNQPVNGVVTGLPPGTEAWIVVYPVQAPAYWPQPGPLALGPTGAFRTSAYFGASATQNIGEEFIVRLVVAPPAASSRFQAFLGPPTPSQGMLRLPPGVLTLTQVTVTRR